jgi:hypothetical protein
MKTLKFRIKTVYGIDSMYPACPDSQFFCEIANTRTITAKLKKILDKHGFTFEQII